MMCEPGCVEHYGCRLREKGVQLSPSATPSRRKWAYRKPRTGQWEKGRVGETRPDGSWMPYLSPRTGEAMGVKEWSEGRHGFEAQIRSLKSDPNVLAETRARASTPERN